VQSVDRSTGGEGGERGEGTGRNVEKRGIQGKVLDVAEHRSMCGSRQ
jgi:hypothetical protein